MNVRLVVEAFLASVQDALVQGEGIEIRGLGSSRFGIARLAWPATAETGSRSRFRPAKRRSSSHRYSFAAVRIEYTGPPRAVTFRGKKP